MSFLRKFSEGYGEAKTKTSVEKDDNIGPKTQLGVQWNAVRRSSRISVKEENSWGEKVTVGEENSKYCREAPHKTLEKEKYHVRIVHDSSLQ